MANVIGNGSIAQLADIDGDPISSTNRLPVETEAEGFTQWTTYPNFQAATTTTALNAGDDNSSYIMIGSSSGTAIASSSIGSRQGIKLNGGQMIILAISSFASIYIDAEVSGQYVSVAYFK
jgi:hypothetical protein